SDDGVPRLVIGKHFLVLLGDDPVLALGTQQNTVDRFFTLFHGDLLLASPCRQDRGLIHQVFQIGARKARSALGQDAQIDVVGQGLIAGVDLQNLLTALDVGTVYDDLAVEAPRTQKGRVEHVGPVGGRHDDDAAVRFEAVHFD